MGVLPLLPSYIQNHTQSASTTWECQMGTNLLSSYNLMGRAIQMMWTHSLKTKQNKQTKSPHSSIGSLYGLNLHGKGNKTILFSNFETKWKLFHFHPFKRNPLIGAQNIFAFSMRERGRGREEHQQNGIFIGKLQEIENELCLIILCTTFFCKYIL